MKTKLIVTGLLSTVVVIGFVMAFGAGMPSAVAHPSGWGSAKHAKIGGPGRHCERLQGKHLQFAESGITAVLGLDDTQRNALAPMVQLLDTWRTQTLAQCEQLESNATTGSVEGKLAQMEALLRRSADTLQAMQPAYASFYASLSAEQQAEVDDMLERHRH